MITKPLHRFYHDHLQAGFGLIELMVSIGVMILVISVILVNHNSYNGATLLRSQAYDLALQLREVQLMSISATEAGTGFRNVYGVHFSTTTDDTYFVFRDADGDYFFDAGVEEFGKQGTLDNRFTIDAIRLVGGAGGTPNQLSITFERPNFDAKFYIGPGTTVAANVSGVEIDVRTVGTVGAGSGKIRTIEISKAGQITVK